MTQTDLNRAVAKATGETVDRVNRIGFNLIPTPSPLPWWRLRQLRRIRQAARRLASNTILAATG